MQERHLDREKYFEEQANTSGNYVIPFIETIHNIVPGMDILEVGCGEGGNLKPFLDRGCNVTGVDILESKITHAKLFYQEHDKRKNIKLIASDIYNPPDVIKKQFDLIIMRDVLEHIHDHDKFMNYIKIFLKPGGLFFLGFPPWQNPFGGHQQMCYNKFLSKLPWFHLLPGRLYPDLMRLFKEPASRIKDLMEIRDTKITIEGFEKIIRKENYQIIKQTFWFINPNYKIKFGLKPRKMNALISGIPYLRNFFITTCYYILAKK